MSEDGKLPEIASASQPQPGDMENGSQPGMDARDIQSANSFNQRGSRSQQPGAGGKTAFIAKKERQDVERDAQLLANRIALLKQEELKTRKKIEETRKRAGEVMKLKQRNNEKVQEKMEKMQYDQMVSQQAKGRINAMRKERNIEKTKIQQSILMSKHEEARQAKLKAQQDNARKQQQLEYVQRLNLERKSRIKFDEQVAKQKAEESRRRKIAETRANIARQIEEEQRLIANKEQEVMQMELIEMELIKKLQNTQAIQKQAYQDLEAAIQQRSTLGKDMMGSSGYRSQSNGAAGQHFNPGNSAGMSGDGGVRQSHDREVAQEGAQE